MKYHALFLLVLAASTANCQSTKSPTKPDLSKFSSDQLRACYNDKTICGTQDQSAISDELASRLPKFSTDQLVACFADWKICGSIDSTATGWPISDEIARRGGPHALLMRYRIERNPRIRSGIVEVAYHFQSPEASGFMETVLEERKLDSESLFWAADYLAENCNAKGLSWLSSRKGRDLGCIQFAGTVKVFGKCLYRPSIPYLVRYSLRDACLNVVGDAEESLEKLYPDHLKKFVTLESEQQYYCSRALQEGFHIDCDSE
jgi:hypothetical protein